MNTNPATLPNDSNDSYEQMLMERELEHLEQMDNDDAPEDNLTDVEADSMTLAGVYGDPEDCDRDEGGDW